MIVLAVSLMSDQRVWRVRKRQRQIDAEVLRAEAGAGSDVVLRYGSRILYRRRWDTRDLAEADARAKLAELERAGWITHW